MENIYNISNYEILSNGYEYINYYLNIFVEYIYYTFSL